MKTGESTYRFNQVFFQKKAHKNYQDTIKNLKKIINFFLLFNVSFFLIFFLQIISFSILFSLINPSVILAVLLASMFLTSFTYFVLLYYFQSKKTDQLLQLKDNFINVCKKALSIPTGSAEHHLTIALAALKLSQNISENENSFIKIPKIFFSISKKLNSYLLKEDLFKFKEQLLIAASLEHLKQLKLTPTDLEVHSSLANIYTSLSKLYFEAKETIFFSKNTSSVLNQKYEVCINTTIEEFKILNDYAPNDPWIHLQLANSYNRLGLKKEEIKEYEIMYKLCPNDNNILFKLGCLYFETKKNAKGLRIYEELQMRAFPDSDKLLSHYGIFKTEEILSETI